MKPVAVVHYHEISLKGGNRPLFLRRLGDNLRQATTGFGVERVRRLPGRLVLDLAEDADLALLRARLATVFGVAYFASGLAMASSTSTAGPGRVACRSGCRAAWLACSRAGSTRRWPPTGYRSAAARS